MEVRTYFMAGNALGCLQGIDVVKSLTEKEFEQVLSLELEEIEVINATAYVNRITINGAQYLLMDTGNDRLVVRVK